MAVMREMLSAMPASTSASRLGSAFVGLVHQRRRQ
jgi:hypothetical protein